MCFAQYKRENLELKLPLQAIGTRHRDIVQTQHSFLTEITRRKTKITSVEKRYRS